MRHLSAKIRTSHCSVSVKPTPMAWPLTAAITGLRTCHAGTSTAAALNVDSSRGRNVSPPDVMSAPAQKAGGVPVSTTARIPSSASQRRRLRCAVTIPVSCAGERKSSGRSWKHSVLAALLARQAGRPVQLVLDREAENLAAGNRNATRQRVRLGAKRDGTLTVIEAQILIQAGAFQAGGEDSDVIGIYQTLYRCPHLRVEQSAVFTNTGPAIAFRADLRRLPVLLHHVIPEEFSVYVRHRRHDLAAREGGGQHAGCTGRIQLIERRVRDKDGFIRTHGQGVLQRLLGGFRSDAQRRDCATAVGFLLL